MPDPTPQTQAMTAPPKREPLAHLKNLLDASRPSMAAVIPKHLTPERLIKVALVAVSKTPALMAADPMTIVHSVMQAAQLGLDPGGALGSAYLVPFRNRKTGRQECQLIVGYRGLIDLARRSGQIESVEARPVYENDAFEVSFGTDTHIHHKPCLDGDPGALRFVYSVAWLKDTPRPVVEVMNRTQIEKIRRRSKAGEDGPWVTDYDEMSRKTVVRRISKYLPLSPELATALELAGVARETEDGGAILPMPGVEITMAEDQSAAGPGEVVTAAGEIVDAAVVGTSEATPAPGAPASAPDAATAAPTEPATRGGRIAQKAREAAAKAATDPSQPTLV